MTTGTSARHIAVRRVAGDALGVGFGREHRLILVTARAGQDLSFAKVVRLVTAGALWMPDGQRFVVDM